MTTGWTGGQYSIYRVLLALAVTWVLISRLIDPDPSSFGFAPLLVAGGLVGCTALALGWHDRITALVLLVVPLSAVAVVDGAPLVLPGTDMIIASVLLVLHAATPGGPYGSWIARDRPNPGGDWQMPNWVPHIVWGLLGVAYLVTDLERLSGVAFSTAAIDAGRIAWLGVLFDIWFVVAVVRVRSRASAWIAMSLWRIAWAAAFGVSSGLPIESNLWLLHLLAFDPAWIVSRSGQIERSPEAASTSLSASALSASASASSSASAGKCARLFYDGDCGLCHRTVRFLLSEERPVDDGLRLRFAPLGGDAFEATCAASTDVDTSELPDSIVLEIEDGRMLTRSQAVIEIANRLGGYWRAIAFIVSLGGLVPNAVLDAAYDFVANHRKRFFASPKDSCPILPPDLRLRFDL